MRGSLVTVAKWIWIAVVLATTMLIIHRTWGDIAGTLAEMSRWLLASSILLIMAAKLFLAENARIAAARNGFPVGYGVAARLYNLSQLGKYLPGSIWQFVGRAAAYRHLGASYAQIRDSLLIESLWVVIGAAFIGIIMAGPGIYPVMTESLAPFVLRWLAGGFAAVVLTTGLLLVWKRDLIAHYVLIATPSFRGVAVQMMIWGLLGVSFWLLTKACGLAVDPIFATGLFAVAYATGFLVPFAPAGLGIRDGILTVGLLPFATAGEALAVTVLARLAYLIVDLLMVAIQEMLMLTPAGRRLLGGGLVGTAADSPGRCSDE